MQPFGKQRKIEGVASIRNLGLVAFSEKGEKHTRLMCQLGTSDYWYILAADGSTLGVKQANGWMVKELNQRLNANVETEEAPTEGEEAFAAAIAGNELPDAEEKEEE